MTRTNLPNSQDEWLADFADQVLDGKVTDLSTVSVEPELRMLADTILRLKTAFPAQATDAASAKRVQARILAHARDEDQRRTRWEKYTRNDWFAQRRPRTAIAALVTVLVLAVVAGTGLIGDLGPITGTAFSAEWFLWIVLGVLAIGALWLMRRK